jgi:small conductance mechanosensitive channel
MGLSPETIGQISDWVVTYGLRAIYAAVIWYVGMRGAKFVGGLARNALTRHEGIDPSLARFAGQATSWLILAVIAIAILNLFKIETTSLVAMLGAATLAIGLALKDTISHFAAGVMILLFKPFRTGQYVEIGGHAGTVKDVNLFRTELATVDNVQIVLPNAQAWSTALKNYSAYDLRRMDLTVGIDYGANSDHAVAVVRYLIKADPRALDDPEPFVKMTNLGASSVDVTLRVWCKREDVFDLKFDLTRAIKLAFDREGIGIPYPHLEVIQKQA